MQGIDELEFVARTLDVPAEETAESDVAVQVNEVAAPDVAAAPVEGIAASDGPVNQAVDEAASKAAVPAKAGRPEQKRGLFSRLFGRSER